MKKAGGCSRGFPIARSSPPRTRIWARSTNTRASATAIFALKQHARRMLIPRLDSLFALALAESKLSLGDFLREPPMERTPAHNSIAYASPHMRAGIGRFAKSMFEQIERMLQGVGTPAASPGRTGGSRAGRSADVLSRSAAPRPHAC